MWYSLFSTLGCSIVKFCLLLCFFLKVVLCRYVLYSRVTVRTSFPFHRMYTAFLLNIEWNHISRIFPIDTNVLCDNSGKTCLLQMATGSCCNTILPAIDEYMRPPLGIPAVIRGGGGRACLIFVHGYCLDWCNFLWPLFRIYQFRLFLPKFDLCLDLYYGHKVICLYCWQYT